jgi:hypothetical protein
VGRDVIFVGGERREDAGEGERRAGAFFFSLIKLLLSWHSMVFHIFGVKCKSRNHAR